jgi:hypothetical protein
VLLRELDIFLEGVLDNLGMLASELIDLGLGKVASGYLVLEKNIKFPIGAVLWLGKAEISPGEEKETSTSAEKTRL